GPPLRHPGAMIRHLAFSPTGKHVATGNDNHTVNGTVHVWDAATGRPAYPPLRLTNTPSALAFSPDGKLLASGDYHGLVRLWDAATGKPAAAPLRQGDIVASIAFSPDGKTLAVGIFEDHRREPKARFWDVATGKPLGEPMAHAKAVV